MDMTERLAEIEVDASDFDPRTYWQDPTGVDGALHGESPDAEVVNAEVDDLGDLGDLFPH